MRVPKGLDDSARAVAAVAGAVTVVAAIVVFGEVHKYGVLAIAFLVLGAVVTLVVPGPAGPGVGALFGGISTSVLGTGLFHLKPEPSAAHALIGDGLPSTMRYFAWLAGVVMVLAAVVAMVASFVKTKRRKPSVKVGGLVAVVVLAAAVPLAGALVDVARDRYANADHTTATARPPVADAGAPTWQHQRWQREAPDGDPVETNSALVPGHGLVVLTELFNDRPDVLRVLDARTGAERWHDRIRAGSAFVDAHDGRVVVVDDPAVVVFDLETGDVLGAARLPAAADDASWYRFTTQPGVTGRTVLLQAESGTTKQVLALDAVTLGTTVIDHASEQCRYEVPQGSRDTVQLIRTRCATPASLEVTGDRLVATVPLPVSATDSLQEAVATTDGAVLDFGRDGSLLAVHTGRRDPVVLVEPQRDELVGTLVLPATGRDPDRVLVSRVKVPSDTGPVVELLDTSGATLPTPPGAASAAQLHPSAQVAVGDRVYLTQPGGPDDVTVLDAHTLVPAAALTDPCDVDGRSVAGSVGLVQCRDGRLLAYD